MRLNAYIMLGDPAFLGPSVRSYYAMVDRIVVSYDENATSWTGTPLPIERCLEIMRELDTEGKCDYRPGHFGRSGFDPLANDTHQRSIALAQAGDGADWVLQLDTDEVVPRPDVFLSVLANADASAAWALDYPARWLYTRVSPGRFLEASTRSWRTACSYPGPLAVRAGTLLELARQTEFPKYRADVRPWNTDPAAPPHTVVHEVVPAEAAVLHYSWVRSSADIARKVGWSGHSEEWRTSGKYGQWLHSTRHPWSTALKTPFAPKWRQYRLSRVADFPDQGV
ncbi:hypothetical protein GCM10010460_17470 [Microbacterium terrae]|uniref:Glycosyl transferase family 2 n=2 Tax=Microbacterium terrae TaxID=69369 RepID=A0A0M2HEQ6_9MICO|nr:hypothetical protein RS81_01049 [Microbacterium terrae]GLJ97979.1 hypothetical protein GCM10017594_11760 [Microbacterium terrae]